MPKTVLVVDDETVITEITKRKLEALGYEVMTANDGEQALAEMGKKVPDLVLLDVEMPKMNGYTFIIEKGKVPAYAQVPVVVMTAYGQMEPLFERHGALAYLLKPLKPQDVLAKVAEVIGSP